MKGLAAPHHPRQHARLHSQPDAGAHCAAPGNHAAAARAHTGQGIRTVPAAPLLAAWCASPCQLQPPSWGACAAQYWKDAHKREDYIDVLNVEGALYAVSLFLGIFKCAPPRPCLQLLCTVLALPEVAAGCQDCAAARCPAC